MGKTVPIASFRRATRPDSAAVTAFVDLGDAPAEASAAPLSKAEMTPVDDCDNRSAIATSTDERSRPPSRWRRKTMTRADGRELRKQTFYLDAELSHKLMVTCASYQYDLSEAIEEAVNLWLRAKRA